MPARWHELVSRLLFVPQAALGLISGYLAVLTVAAWVAVRDRRAATPPSAPVRHRFAVLIPAHNEELLIAACLRSLAALDYPDADYAVHVVADNCTDATGRIAREHGVEVHERVAPEDPGKGPALTWLLRRLEARVDTYDGVVIVDADSVVSPNFLRVMDHRLASGAEAIQSRYAVRDPGDSTAVAIRYAALAARNHLRPLGRTRLGGSAGLFGNGMAFSADVLRGRSWSGDLTEDLEFEARLLRDGIAVEFAADAVVEAEMPRRLDDARAQNERWERGRLEVARRHLPSLLRSPAIDPVVRVDAAADHVVPPLAVLTSATTLVASVSMLLWRLRRSGLARCNALTAAFAVTAQVAYVVSALRISRAPSTVWRAMGSAPRYAAWKVGLWVRVARSGDVPWVRTVRNEPDAVGADLRSNTVRSRMTSNRRR